MIDSRSDVSLLKDRHPGLWSRYSHLREAVAEQAFTARRTGFFDLPKRNYTAISSQRMEDVKNLEEVEQQIRSQSGFERFQLPPTEIQLHYLARHCSIVSFNISKLGSHAFLVTGNSKQVLRLPKFISEDLNKHISRLPGGNQSRRDAKLIPAEGDDTVKDNMNPNDIAESMCWL